MKVMVVTAHADDETLGCGATIKKLTSAGNEVYLLILAELGYGARYTSAQIKTVDTPKIIEYIKKSSEILGFKWILSDYCFKDNQFDSHPLLDIVKTIEKYKEKYNPEVIYTHNSRCLNIDHQNTYRAAVTATRPMREEPVKDLFTFEIPSSTEWKFGGSIFTPNIFVSLTKKEVEAKIEAFKCYESEIRNCPHPRSVEGVLNLMKFRGYQCGSLSGYAEAFYLVRSIR